MNIIPSAPRVATSGDSKTLIRSIQQACPQGDWQLTRRLIEQLYRQRDWSFSPISTIVPKFRQHGQEAKLAEILWDCRDVTLKDVRTVATFIELCGADTWDSDYFEPAYALIRDIERFENSFAENDFLSSFGKLSAKASRYLLHLKFGKFIDVKAGDDIFETARNFASAIMLNPETSKFLYERSRVKLASERDWALERKIVYFLDHFFSDAGHIHADRAARLDKATLADVFDRDQHLLDPAINSAEAEATFARIKETGPYLLCTFHAGNYLVSQSMFRAHMVDHWVIQNRGCAATNVIVVSDDRLNSAFKAIKILMSGKSILIAPDSNVQDSRSVSDFNILGSVINIPDGAARIAYEAGAKTAWYTAAIEGSRYVPIFVEGPQRTRGEKFETYKTRFYEFYSEQVSLALSSHPRNTVLKSFYVKYLSSTPARNAGLDSQRTSR